MSVIAVDYECAELAYPPTLLIHTDIGKIRILLDFAYYYDGADYHRLAEEAKSSGYDFLAYTVPNVSEDEFFTTRQSRSTANSKTRSRKTRTLRSIANGNRSI